MFRRKRYEAEQQSARYITTVTMCLADRLSSDSWPSTHAFFRSGGTLVPQGKHEYRIQED